MSKRKKKRVPAKPAATYTCPECGNTYPAAICTIPDGDVCWWCKHNLSLRGSKGGI